MKKQILLVFGFAILLASCSSKPQDTIVGRWQDKNNPAIIEFFPDGTMNYTSKMNNAVSGQNYGGIGAYKMLDADHMKIDWPDGVTHRGPITEIVKITLTKDDLTTFDNSSGVQLSQFRKLN